MIIRVDYRNESNLLVHVENQSCTMNTWLFVPITIAIKTARKGGKWWNNIFMILKYEINISAYRGVYKIKKNIQTQKY